MAIKYGSGPRGPSIDTVTDPQKLFQALPKKSKKYQYLRDVQGDVLRQWHTRPKAKDTVLKMNTGAGKTTVGLLLLKCSINDGAGPGVYLSPDYYLCSQVSAEAEALGLSTTDDPRSSDYQKGRAILVIPISNLVNGLSKFGVGRDIQIPIGTIVVDDAHACLADAEQRFSLSLPRDYELYDELLSIFADDIRTQSQAAVEELSSGDPQTLVQVPYWAWKDKQSAILRALTKKLPEREKKFVWPLLKEDLAFCRCLLTSKRIEIASRCLPIDSIPSFDAAKRRVYMTATLSDDAVLVTDFGADPAAVKSPITPKTASDLGERMILVPQELNSDVTEEELRDFVARYARKRNVVIIVPSGHRAKFWSSVTSPGLLLTADNLDAGIKSLKSKRGQLAVLVNKYDGIDLPDDACRLLVIDGLPDTSRLLDRYEQGTLSNSERTLARKIQRIEQGMGRGIRSNEDYCVVLLMGGQLLRALFASGASRYFSPATLKQMELSKNIAEQIRGKDLDALAEPIADALRRHPDWVAESKNALIDVSYEADEEVDAIAVAQRRAFDASRNGKHEQASQLFHSVADASNDAALRGWLLELAAEAIHPTDKVRSQVLLSAASDLNRRVTKPLGGIAYKKLEVGSSDQAVRAGQFLRKAYGEGGNALVLGMAGILSDLVFREEGSEAFEQALADLGLHFGFRSQRPEKEGITKLDVLWALGANRYILWACKSEAVVGKIAKQYTDQAGGNLNWFSATYDPDAEATPVLVHPSSKLEKDASPPSALRVLDRTALTALIEAARSFGTAVKDRLDDPPHIRATLNKLGLAAESFAKRFTSAPARAK